MNRFPSPSGPEASFRRIQDLLARERLGEALPELERLVRAHPGFYPGQVALGLTALKLDRKPMVFSALAAAVKLRPNLAEPYYHLALAFQFYGEIVFAKRAFAQAMQAEPGHTLAALGMARLILNSGYLALGGEDEAMHLLCAVLESQPDQPEALGLLLEETRLKDDWESVLELGSHLQSRQPDHPALVKVLPSPWFSAAGVEAARAGDSEALRHLEICLRDRPGWAEAHLEAGWRLHRGGREAEARARFQDAHKLDPELWERVLNDGKSKELRGFLEAAMQDYQRAILLKPGAVDLGARLQDPFFHFGFLDLADRLCQFIVDQNAAHARRAGLESGTFRLLRIFTNQIGHMGHLDWYLKLDRLGLRAPERPVIVAPFSANGHLLSYWRELVPDVVTDPQEGIACCERGRLQEDGLCAIKGADGRQVADYSYRRHVEVQQRWEREGRPPLLALREEDRERGRACLQREFGIPRDAWFVSLHVRSDQASSLSDGSRNVGIESYFQALAEITARGGWVLRMGDPGMPKLPDLPQVVDYAHSAAKSDWMDVFLWAACRFFLGTNSGPIFIPPAFGVPVVATNWTPFGIPDLFLGGLCIFKNYRLEAEDRLLSFPELLETNLGYTNVPALIATLGIRQLDNSAEEIREVVLEMLERLDGAPVPEADGLQRRFDALPGKVPGVGLIGGAFLRRYAHLLEAPAGRFQSPLLRSVPREPR